MEECVPMPDTPNELLFTFLTMTVSAKGSVAFFVAAAVSVLILAVASRLMPPRV
jgi:low affinity Fe/Cu permease